MDIEEKENATQKAEEVQEWIPNYIKNQDKKQKKIFFMCKYFAHGYQCTWTKRYGNCKQVHSEEVKAAHDYICTMKKEDQLPNTDDIVYLLSRKGKLNELQTKVNQRLLNTYPRELSEDEIKRIREDQMKDQLNDEFMKMYHLTEEEAKDHSETTI